MGGQKNPGMDDKLGTLEEGKTADIAIPDKNVFKVFIKKVRNVKVVMTIVDRKIVYEKEEMNKWD